MVVVSDSHSGSSSDDIEYSVMRIAGQRYHDTTTVYTSGSGAEVFHADKHCPHLKGSKNDYTGKVHLTAHALPKVLQSYTSPIKRCKHCTLPMQDTVRVAVQQDGLDPALLKYYKPGDVQVTERWTKRDDGDYDVKRWKKPVRPEEAGD